MGVIFHLSILFMMGLIFFGLMMAVSVLIFVRSDELRAFFKLLKRKYNFCPWWLQNKGRNRLISLTVLEYLKKSSRRSDQQGSRRSGGAGKDGHW